MDDMTAFDRQIAGEVLLGAGPSEPVDDLAIYESVVAANRQKGWGFTMFSALKFVAAAVILALFGGFLLAGILTTQQDGEVPPAAVTESPTPMTTEELLSGMVTEEVEPGVYKVVNDGFRDLAISVVGPGYSVEVGPRGSVWLSSEVGGPGAFRLGGESRSAIPGDPTTLASPIRVARDGSLWVIAGYPDDRTGIFSFDGQGWTEQAITTERLEGLAIGPDGTVWVTGAKSDRCLGMASGECPDTLLMRLEDDGSLTTIEDWADVYDGHAYPAPLVVSADGDVWLIGDRPTGDPFGADVLLRFDGSAWEVLPLPEGFESHPMDTGLGFGLDGTLWVHAGGFVRHDAPDLIRFDDPGWSLFTVPGGTRSDVSGRDGLTVAADGSFWLPGKSVDRASPGVAHYDGTTATPYLVGSAPSDLAIAPDGSVWLYSEAGRQGHPYVITPEAIGVKEAEVIEPPTSEEATDDEMVATTTEELLSGMVTEEVEPGVFRVLNDGVRDLSSTDYGSVVAGQDASIWLEHSGDLSRLGVVETHDWQLGEWDRLWDFEIAHDGTVWAVTVSDEGQALRSFDGESWATHRAVDYFSGQDGDVEVVLDGVVWAALGDGTLGHLDVDGSTWQTIETPAMRPATVTPGPLLPAEIDDQWGLFGQDIWEFGFVATESDVWTPYFGGVSHYADGAWEHVPYGGPDTGALPDDVFWGLGQAADSGPVLYRHDGTGWQQWFLGEDDRLGSIGWLVGPHAVAPDGSFWAVRPDCLGVNRFDGSTWAEYLPGTCVDDIDIAADGSVWLLADRGLYVITPEAVAGTE